MRRLRQSSRLGALCSISCGAIFCGDSGQTLLEFRRIAHNGTSGWDGRRMRKYSGAQRRTTWTWRHSLENLAETCGEPKSERKCMGYSRRVLRARIQATERGGAMRES